MDLTVILIILISFLLLFYVKKEGFVIEEVRSKLYTPENDITSEYSHEIDTPHKKKGVFIDTKKELPIPIITMKPKNDVKKDLLAFNDDIKYEQKIIQSLNVEIDEKINKILKKIDNVILSDTTLITTDQLNKHDVINLLQIFIKYLNKITNYQFSILEIGKSELISNNYKISFFIYENRITFVKRLTVNIKNIPQNNTLILKNVELPVDAVLDKEALLPPAIKSVEINNINDNNIFFKVKSDNFYLIDEEDVKKEKERQIKLKQLQHTYNCFGIPNAELINSKEECLQFKGKWDKPVKKHNECPYYKSNKNYKNTRGGVKHSSYCELPSGMKQIGYRYYDDEEEYNPLCYNCSTNLIGQGTLGKCCHLQSNPDYKFPGDKIDRLNQANELHEKKLTIT